jgi:hypothetical protein
METTQNEFSNIASLQTAAKHDDQLRSEKGRRLDGVQGQLVVCLVDELRHHPSYSRHHLVVPPSHLSALAELDDLVFLEPVVITRDRIIIDGYARRELARLKKRLTLPCIEYELTEAEALHWLLQKHRRSKGLNDYNRIQLALELEPWFRRRAQANQRFGGQSKGTSNLTEADRLDVRSEIAAAAGVSAGNVTKVKSLTVNAASEVLQALRSGDLSIHRASLWMKETQQKQCDMLRSHQSERGIRKTIRALISRHKPKGLSAVFGVGSLLHRLSTLSPDELSDISVFIAEKQGRTIYLTEELARALESPEKLEFTSHHIQPSETSTRSPE